MEFGFETLETEAASLHYATIGDPRATPVICLHGFPEFWIAWRAVMERLADRYFLVAPDQRGFNLSSKPAEREAYRAKHLVADIAALADHVAPERPVVLAGHDWGASVAYAYAFAKPDRVSHLVIANGVHPACFQRAIFEDEAQRLASQYINKLRAPDAEERLSADGYRRLFRMIEGFSRTEFMTGELREAYRLAWSRPGALTGMLNWYRATPVAVPKPGAPAPESRILALPAEALAVTVPHLVVWGEADEALTPACIADLPRYASDLTIRRVPDSGHWILHERPDEVAGFIDAFVAGERG